MKVQGRKCDVCGSIVDDKQYYEVSIAARDTKSDHYENMVLACDLCEGCYNTLFTAFVNRKKGFENNLNGVNVK